MKKATIFLLFSMTTLLLAGCASTPQQSNATNANGTVVVKNLENVPKQGKVVVTGKVDDIYDDHMFILRDQHSSVEVVSKTKPMDVEYGEKVTVTGTVKRSALGSILGDRPDVNAKKIKLPDGKVIDL